MIAKIDLLSVQTGIAYAFYEEDGAFISIDSSGVTHVSDGIYIIDFTPPEDASLMIVTSDDYDLRVPVDLDEILQISKIRSDVGSIKSKTDNLNDLSAGDVRDELATELSRIDAAISSRSTYDGSDTAGTSTLLDRLTSGRAGNLDKLDAAVSTRSSHAAADVWSVGTRTLTSFGSLVSDIATAVWGAGARTLTAIADSSGVTTLLGRLTAGRAGHLDKLDVSGTLAHSDAADIYKADVSGLATETSLASAADDILEAIGEVEGGGLDASGVRAALGMSAANLDDQLSGLATSADIGGLNDLSASDIRTELSTELGRIDADISSRMAGAGYVAPLSYADTQAAAHDALTEYDPPTRAEATADKEAVLDAVGDIDAGGVDVPSLVSVVGQLLSDALTSEEPD